MVNQGRVIMEGTRRHLPSEDYLCNCCPFSHLRKYVMISHFFIIIGGYMFSSQFPTG